MQTVIFCGGTGTRLRELTELTPKPMIRVGEHPMLWHLMKLYSHYDFKNFVLALGYKREVIQDYFHNYKIHEGNITILPNGNWWSREEIEAPWTTVKLIDTGFHSNKAERLLRVKKYLKTDSPFMCTYGDAVADIDLKLLLEFHKAHGKIATITGVHPPPRFGELVCDGIRVTEFSEKPVPKTVINGGFMVFNWEIWDYIKKYVYGDLESKVLSELAEMGELMCFHHKGYWGCMDTIKDVDDLNRLWEEGKAPWKVWE